jgi:hypothetical protein
VEAAHKLGAEGRRDVRDSILYRLDTFGAAPG